LEKQQYTSSKGILRNAVIVLELIHSGFLDALGATVSPDKNLIVLEIKRRILQIS
jgi:hypothetical protein